MSEKEPTLIAGSVPAMRAGSGAKIYDGRYFLDENVELRDIVSRQETFREMSQTDAYIYETLQQNTLPLLGAAVWKCQAWDRDKASDEDKKFAAFADCVLLRNPSKDWPDKFAPVVGFKQFLGEVLTMLPNGFSIFHIQPKLVDGKRTVNRFLWLEPSSIDRWDIDASDNLQGVFRNYQRPDGTWTQNEYIPVKQLALFVWNPMGTRLEGLSMLRPMFGPWRRKEFLQKCKMIAAQRASVGIPFAKRDPTEDVDDTKTTNNTIERFMRSLLGPGLEFGYLSSANKTLEIEFLTQAAQDFEKFDHMVADENMAFAHAGSSKASMLGETPSGARSVGAVQQTVQYVIIEAIAQMVKEQMETGVGNVRGPLQIVLDWNFPSIEIYPRIRVSNVDPAEAQRNIPLLNDSAQKGTIRKLKEVEKYILNNCGLDMTDEEIESAEELPVAAPLLPVGPDGLPMKPAPGVPPGTPPGPGQPKKPLAKQPSSALPGSSAKNDPARAAASRRMSIAAAIGDWLRVPTYDLPSSSTTGMRAPSLFEEKCVAAGHIATTLADGVTRMDTVLAKSWHAMIVDVADKIRSDKLSNGTLEGLRRSSAKGTPAMRKNLRDAFAAVAEQGRREAGDEMRRQLQTAGEYSSVALGIKMDDSSQPMNPGDDGADESGYPHVIPPGGTIPTGASASAAAMALAQDLGWDSVALFDEVIGEATVTSTMTLDAMWQRLLTEAIAEMNRLARTGLKGEELASKVEAFLMTLSDRPMSAVSRQVTSVAYNQGRDVAGKLAAASGDAAYAIRSELLDSRTCGPCAGIDGTIYLIGSEEYERNMPPSGCNGRDLCRGFMVFISTTLADKLSPGGQP